jgi:hypothetical protein
MLHLILGSSFDIWSYYYDFHKINVINIIWKNKINLII